MIPGKRYVESYFENCLLLNIHVSPTIKLSLVLVIGLRYRDGAQLICTAGHCSASVLRGTIPSIERKDDAAYTVYVYVLTMNVLWTVPDKASFF